jgi:hypothetical protein
MQRTTIPAARDIMEQADEREMWIVAKEMERPPYWFPDEGMGNRLSKAIRIVSEGRITPNSDGSYTVEGSGGRTYRCAESCSCPSSQKSKSKWCYHLCATSLYVEWKRRLRPVAPVVLGTLRAGTMPLPREDDDEDLGNGFPVDDETLPLPLPPVTVDERLALSTVRDSTALSTHHTPQEDRMADDGYIPEPDDAPVAVLDASTPTRTLTPTTDLERSMQMWSEQRHIVKKFLQQELVEGTDFYTLRIKGRETKPALSKAGSEKFLALFQVRATFAQDAATWEMLGKPEGTLCYVCHLHTRSGELMGEGRGARTVQQDGGDINKAVKMGQKSALVDAILRTGALSDVFTQDLDEAVPSKPSNAQEQRARIWHIVQERAPQVRTRESSEAWVHEHTGLSLHPDNYEAILRRLEER